MIVGMMAVVNESAAVNKTETNKKGKISLFLIGLFLAAVFSCERTIIAPENAPIETETPETEAISVETRPVQAETAREMILIRGNYWESGISGFGLNRFSALTGEYKLEGVSDSAAARKNGEENVFSVQLTTEPLFFSEEWQSNGQRMTDIQVFERQTEEGFLSAFPLDDGRGASWTAVFRFPFGIEEAGLTDEDFNLLLRVWTRRVFYFLLLAKSPGELSLPAAVEF